MGSTDKEQTNLVIADGSLFFVLWKS